MAVLLVELFVYIHRSCTMLLSRVVFDRGFTEWDDGLTAMNVDCTTMTPDSTSEYVRHIRHNSM